MKKILIALMCCILLACGLNGHAEDVVGMEMPAEETLSDEGVMDEAADEAADAEEEVLIDAETDTDRPETVEADLALTVDADAIDEMAEAVEETPETVETNLCEALEEMPEEVRESGEGPQTRSDETIHTSSDHRFGYQIVDGHAKVVVYYSLEQMIDIPEYMDGWHVEEIDTSKRNDWIGTLVTGISIPGSIKKIPDYAFNYWDDLETVILNEGIEEIGNNAFEVCYGLPTITLPQSLKKIGDYAFNFGNYTMGTSSLRGELDIPDGVTEMGANAFCCTGFSKVRIGNGLTEIKSRAFDSCNNLEEVSIGNSVASIGYNAFASCSNLKKMIVPASVKSINMHAFYNCPNLVLYAEDVDTVSRTSGVMYNHIPVLPLDPGSVKISETFHDSGFQRYIAGTFDLDGNGWLSSAEIRQVESMRIQGFDYSVYSLEGIEVFSELKYLYTNYTDIQEVDLRENTKLVSAEFENNHSLYSISVQGLKSLKHLRCFWLDDIEEIDVSSNPNLEELYMLDCGLTSLDVSGNPKLTELCCANNQLSTLDVSGNPKLESLYCAENELVSLKLGKKPALVTLEAFANQLTTLDVTYCPLLNAYIKPANYGEFDTYNGDAGSYENVVGYEDPNEWIQHIVYDRGVDLKSVPTYTLKASGKTVKMDFGKKLQLLKSTSSIYKCTTSNAKIAKVTNDGMITSMKKAGTATITVTLKNKKKVKLTVKVLDFTIPTKVSIVKPASTTLYTGQKQRLTVKLTAPGVASSSILWTSSNKRVATVSTKGLVTCRAAGYVTITAKAKRGGKKATITLRVKKAPLPSSISIEQGASLDMALQETRQLSIVMDPAYAKSSITWKSSNPLVVSVSKTGLVEAKDYGNATITATSTNKKTATIFITVN